MAITSPNRLFSPKINFNQTKKSEQPEQSLEKNLESTNKKLTRILKFVKSEFKLKKEFDRNKKRSEENKKRDKKENLLEKVLLKNSIKGAKKFMGVFKSPLDAISNFLNGLILAFIVDKLFPILPHLVKVVKLLGPVFSFLEFLGGVVLETIVNFIDIGYKAYDTIRSSVGFLGGEELLKAFDKFSSIFNTFINIALIAALASIDFGDGFGFDKKNKKTNKPPKKPKVTTSGGKSVGALDRLKDTVTDPFRRKPKVTTSGGKSVGALDRLKDTVTDPFRRKPKVTTSGRKSNGIIDRIRDTLGGKPKVTGTPKPKGGNIFSGLGEIGEMASKKVGSLYKNTIGKLAESVDNLIKQGPKKLMEWMSNQKGIIGELGKKLPGFFDSPLIKKIGKALPFVGDVVGFVFDIINGIDWRRALIRAVVGATIDAGFNTLAAALVAATPFTGGASTAVAIALYASYMAADVASGGFGKILGDKVADFLKLPMKSGEKSQDAPPPKSPGTESDLKKVQEDIERKRKEDPEFDKKVSSTEKSKDNKKEETTSTEKSKDNKKEETSSFRFGGIIDKKILSFNEGGLNDRNEIQKQQKEKRVTRTVRLSTLSKISQKPKSIQVGKSVSGGEKRVRKFYDKVTPDENKKSSEKDKDNSNNIFSKIKSLFFGSDSDSTKSKKDKKVHPSEFLDEGYKKLSKVKNLGFVFSLSIKPLLGETPSKMDYYNASVQLVDWMRNFENATSFSDGGEVERTDFSKSDITKLLASNLEKSLKAPIDDIVSDLSRTLVAIKDIQEDDKDKPSDDANKDGPGGGDLNAEPIDDESSGDGTNHDNSTHGQPGPAVSTTSGFNAGKGDKSRKIFLHWTAGSHTTPFNNYHTTFLGDGRAVRYTPYDKDKYTHTGGGNTNSVGLSIAAMGGGTETNFGKYPPTSAQVSAMALEAARLAVAWGWDESTINSNVRTHGEWERYATSAKILSGKPQRWDLDKLQQKDPMNSGGDKLRKMIKEYFRELKKGASTDSSGKTKINSTGQTLSQMSLESATQIVDRGSSQSPRGGGGSFDESLAKLLKVYEGLKTQAYLDAVGIPTIGMGATYYPKGFRLSGKVKMGDTITEQEALWIKQQHIKEHRQRLLREVPSSTYAKVPDNVKAALESKVFNYGSLGKNLTNLVKSSAETGNYSSVSSYFRNTLAKHDGGLNSRRRNDEAGIIDTGTSKIAKVSFSKKSGSEAEKSYGSTPKAGKATEKYEGKDPRSKDGPKISGGSVVNIGKSLVSQGFSVAEHPDFTKTIPKGKYTPGKGIVSNVHKGRGHYEGRAIDVTDWRGSLEDSKKRYRQVLDSLQGNPSINMLIHDSWGFKDPTGKSGPGSHGHPTHMHIETKSRFHGGPIEKDSMVKIHAGEFVVDKDSVDIFGMDFLKSINSVENLSGLKNVSPYLIERVSEVVKGKKVPKTDEYVKEEDPRKKEPASSPIKTGKFFDKFNQEQNKKPSIQDDLFELREMRSRSLERQGKEPEADLLSSYNTNTNNTALFNSNNKVNFNFNQGKDSEINYDNIINTSLNFNNIYIKNPIFKLSDMSPINYQIDQKQDKNINSQYTGSLQRQGKEPEANLFNPYNVTSGLFNSKNKVNYNFGPQEQNKKPSIQDDLFNSYNVTSGLFNSKNKVNYNFGPQEQNKKPSIQDDLFELRQMRTRSLQRQGKEPEANLLSSYNTNTNTNNTGLFNSNNKVNYNFNQSKDNKVIDKSIFSVGNVLPKQNIDSDINTINENFDESSKNMQKVYKFKGGVGEVKKYTTQLILHDRELFKVVDKASVDVFGTEFVEKIINIDNKVQLKEKAQSIIDDLRELADIEEQQDSQIYYQQIRVNNNIPVNSNNPAMFVISSNKRGGEPMSNQLFR